MFIRSFVIHRDRLFILGDLKSHSDSRDFCLFLSPLCVSLETDTVLIWEIVLDYFVNDFFSFSLFSLSF